MRASPDLLQDDRFDATSSITICAFTTDPTDAPLFRLLVELNTKNGLRAPCRLMIDKITTVPNRRSARVSDASTRRTSCA
jgi:mRNA interferase MazF